MFLTSGRGGTKKTTQKAMGDEKGVVIVKKVLKSLNI